MLHNLRTNLSLFTILAAITGVAYPLVTLGVGQGLMAAKANGSLITVNGSVVGSTLIGQHFADDKYFHSRPSAARDTSATPPDDVSYNPLYSGASNMATTGDDLIAAVKERVSHRKTDSTTMLVPVDMVTASASGLDPHISLANARLQIGRIAEARGLGAAQIDGIIAAHTEARTFGVLGEPRVHVLGANLALDQFNATQPIKEDSE